MSRLFLYTLCLFVVVFSCKQNQGNDTNDNAENENKELTEKEISEIDYVDFLLDEKTETIIANWVEYSQLEGVIFEIKKADLGFFHDNRETIKTTLSDLRKNIPEAIKSPSIEARISAFETQFLKLESLSNLSTTTKDELLSTVKDLLVAFSNLNLQMNKKVEFDNLNIQKP
ncbi:hypothetical protein BWZ22_05710 [Seonamhaeicola sp. S2-3]|uniref:hypothetical protein n=1 Tax=Seonamhaeicola sp. S2-3 TaxID=1936081 RepID=UPI000972C7EC|nr:hypothetical protein [Seonamhaeicola sp. S2-3]APY10768.1 hypothetical protein BWZ22_05710 [Seonamhaeicola sp. S2-3]